MKEETLIELVRRSKVKGNPNMPFYRVTKMKKEDELKAVKFILKLRKKGVSLDKIDVSDWDSAPIIVYVGDGKYYRFSDYDLKNAMKRVKK
jgi:hypothetical protein